MIRAILLTVALLAASIASAPPGNADSFDVLWDLMPWGYDQKECTRVPNDVLPASALEPGALAKFHCPDTPEAGAPPIPEGMYVLFADRRSLADEFKWNVDYDSTHGGLAPCPGGLPSPGPWHHPESPTVVAGQLACVDDPDEVTLSWTRDDDLLAGTIWGPAGSLPQLYDWWTYNGGAGRNATSPPTP
ncbi:MAG: hypothetical protein U0Q20_12780 [Mycobacterium sp.]|nr:hypothetical protein [Mycobacterium sp.]